MKIIIKIVCTFLCVYHNLEAMQNIEKKQDDKQNIQLDNLDNLIIDDFIKKAEDQYKNGGPNPPPPPLHQICANDTLPDNIAKKIFLKLLTEKNIDFQCPCGTPLIVATYYGHSNLVKILLDLGADPNLTDVMGFKALDYAWQLKHIDIFILLLKNKKLPQCNKKTLEEINFLLGFEKEIMWGNFIKSARAALNSNSKYEQDVTKNFLEYIKNITIYLKELREKIEKKLQHRESILKHDYSKKDDFDLYRNIVAKINKHSTYMENIDFLVNILEAVQKECLLNASIQNIEL